MTDEPFVSRYYAAGDGLTLHYRDYAGPSAHAPTVLCLPGLTRNARDFDELAPHLAVRYRVICADLRGRGRSGYAADPATYVPAVYVKDVAALLKSARLRQVAVIGTSLGGIIAMIMAAVMPHRLRGVVLNDIGPDIDQRGLARIASYLGKSWPVKTWADAAAAVKAMDAVIYPDYGDGDWQKMARRRFIEGPDGIPKPDYDFAISKPFAGSASKVDLWPFFAKLSGVPALALRGATSDILSIETFQRMQRVVPELVAVTVPDRGHTPYLDEPAALSAIDTFLAALPRRLTALQTVRRAAAGTVFAVRFKLGRL